MKLIPILLALLLISLPMTSAKPDIVEWLKTRVEKTKENNKEILSDELYNQLRVKIIKVLKKTYTHGWFYFDYINRGWTPFIYKLIVENTISLWIEYQGWKGPFKAQGIMFLELYFSIYLPLRIWDEYDLLLSNEPITIAFGPIFSRMTCFFTAKELFELF